MTLEKVNESVSSKQNSFEEVISINIPDDMRGSESSKKKLEEPLRMSIKDPKASVEVKKVSTTEVDVTDDYDLAKVYS